MSGRDGFLAKSRGAILCPFRNEMNASPEDVEEIRRSNEMYGSLHRSLEDGNDEGARDCVEEIRRSNGGVNWQVVLIKAAVCGNLRLTVEALGEPSSGDAWGRALVEARDRGHSDVAETIERAFGTKAHPSEIVRQFVW